MKKLFLLFPSSTAVCFFLALVFSTTVAETEEKWLEIQSENFRLLTNAKENKGRETLHELEQFRHTLSYILPNLKMSSPTPTHVFAFKNRKSYRPFLPIHEGKPQDLAGYFQSGPYKNIITLDLSSRSEDYEEVIFHEFVHLMLEYSLDAYPLWFEEGVAEFYSTCLIRKDRAEVGRVHLNNRQILNDRPLLPLEQLFEADHDSSTYTDPGVSPVFYAQSWALIHYLAVGTAPEGPKQLKRFLTLLASGENHDGAFFQAFGRDTRKMRQELEFYIGRRLFKYMQFDLKPLNIESDFPSSQLEPAAVNYHMGELLLNTNRLEEAEARLHQSVQQDAQYAPAYESLGFLSLRRSEYENAVGYFKKAMDLDSVNPIVYYQYATTLMRDYHSGGSVNSIPGEIAELSVDALNKCIELNPAFSDAVATLAFIHLVRGSDIDEALALIERNLTLAVAKPRLIFMRGQLLIRKGAYQRAEQDMVWVVRTAKEPELRQMAQQHLERLKLLVDGAAVGDIEKEVNNNQPETSQLREAQGILTRLDCPNEADSNLTFTVAYEGKLLILSATPRDVMVLRDGEFAEAHEFRCGPQAQKVIVSYIPDAGQPEGSDIRGRLLSLNLLSD